MQSVECGMVCPFACSLNALPRSPPRCPRSGSPIQATAIGQKLRHGEVVRHQLCMQSPINDSLSLSLHDRFAATSAGPSAGASWPPRALVAHASGRESCVRQFVMAAPMLDSFRAEASSCQASKAKSRRERRRTPKNSAISRAQREAFGTLCPPPREVLHPCTVPKVCPKHPRAKAAPSQRDSEPPHSFLRGLPTHLQLQEHP